MICLLSKFVDLCIGIQLVEIRHAHCQIGIGKEFYGFGLCGLGEQGGNVFFNRPFFELPAKLLLFRFALHR